MGFSEWFEDAVVKPFRRVKTQAEIDAEDAFWKDVVQKAKTEGRPRSSARYQQRKATSQKEEELRLLREQNKLLREIRDNQGGNTIDSCDDY